MSLVSPVVVPRISCIIVAYRVFSHCSCFAWLGILRHPRLWFLNLTLFLGDGNLIHIISGGFFLILVVKCVDLV